MSPFPVENCVNFRLFIVRCSLTWWLRYLGFPIVLVNSRFTFSNNESDSGMEVMSYYKMQYKLVVPILIPFFKFTKIKNVSTRPHFPSLQLCRWIGGWEKFHYRCGKLTKNRNLIIIIALWTFQDKGSILSPSPWEVLQRKISSYGTCIFDCVFF